jgi:ATP-dependent Lhr-like helicase
MSECGATQWAAEQAAEYVAVQQAALGLIPTCRRIVFERFFDESGGMQLVIHSPLGIRINRAWGLALRKRFCRSFDFELQASADDNGIVLSLGPQHSFPIDQLFRMLNRENAQPLLVQALLAVPLFGVRWRWNATRALAILRQRGGKKVPAPLQRMKSDDLLAAVFPMASACLENVVGDIELPDHPLVRQTVYDCLHEAMDVDHWLELIGDIEAGRVELVARDTREPSPFSHAILNANPYAFLDDAPLEERRARAVATRRTLSAEDAQDLAWLDPEAIARVQADAWPLVRDADELHDVLLSAGAIPQEEASEWQTWFDSLVAAGRATIITVKSQDNEKPRESFPWALDNRSFWIAAENLNIAELCWPGAVAQPPISLPDGVGWRGESTAATLALVRGRMEYCGPTTAPELAAALCLRPTAVDAALELLEAEGAVLRGTFRPASPPLTDHRPPTTDHSAVLSDRQPPPTEWCDRRLLARIHRLTLEGVRRQVQPVEPHDFWRFLIEHQHLTADAQLNGRRGTQDAIAQLQGFELPAGAWERDILPGRVKEYDSDWLDELSLSGDVGWGRLQPPRKAEDAAPTGSKLSRVVPMSLVNRADLPWLLPPDRGEPQGYARSDARAVWDALISHGALFPQDLLGLAGLLPAQLDEALSELAALGLVTSDSFANLRQLAGSDRPRISVGRRTLRRKKRRTAPRSGRWSRFPAYVPAPPADRIERWAWQLLKRYGVIFRDLLARESVAPPWGALAPVFRRLEARGKIRGGRFVARVGGEQFATAEAVEQLRRVRESGPAGKWIVLSAADPLNLVGILTPGARLPAIITNALALLDGRVVAWQQSGELRMHEPLSVELADQITRALRMSTIARARNEQALAATLIAGTEEMFEQKATKKTKVVSDF